MGLFGRFSTPKAYTGVVIAKRDHTSTDSEGYDERTWTVTVKIDSNDGLPRERTLNVPRDLYDKVEVGNDVIKSPDNKHPVIQLGTHRASS